MSLHENYMFRCPESVEYVAQLAENTLLDAVARFHVGFVAELFYGGSFFVVKSFRHVDHHVDKLVARTVAFGGWESFAAQTQYLARLRTRSYLQSGASADGGHFHRSAQCSCREVKHQIVDHVVAVAYQFRMLYLLDDHKQIAVDAAMHRRVAFAFDGESHSVGYSGGNVERYYLLFMLHSGAVAVGAVLLYDLAVAVAFGADGRALAHAEYGLLIAHYRAGSVTCRTGDECRAVLGSSAVAVIAFGKCPKFQCLADPFGNVFKSEFKSDAQIVAATLTLAWTSAGGASEASHVEASVTAEYIAEL